MSEGARGSVAAGESVTSVSTRQMDQVKSEMAELVNARKRAEADMQLLANRLAHLRSEEEKANKRIEETRARAAEIREAKRRSRMRAQQRQQERAEREAEGEQERKAWQAHRLSRHTGVQSALHRSRSSKFSDAESVRRTTQDMTRAKQREEAERRAAIRQRAHEIRAREEAMRRKRAEEERRRQEENERRKAHRMQEEGKAREEAERTIQEMEDEEQRLIARLRTMQLQQQSAYRDLEAVLVGDAQRGGPRG